MARKIKFTPVLTENIDNLPLDDGQLIVDVESNKIAVDASGDRYTIVDPGREGNWKISGSRQEWNSRLANIADWDDPSSARVDYELFIYPEIAFHTNGGTEVQNVSIPVGSSLSEYSLPLTAKEGFIFDGWYAEPEFINLYNLPEIMPAVTEHAYAKWTEDTPEPEK